MNWEIQRVLTFRGMLNRTGYLGIGVVCFLIKFLLDSTIAQLFGRDWQIVNYLIWPDKQSFFIYQLPVNERDFGFALLCAALPFIWIGVACTLARLRHAGMPLGMVLLFFIPFVNLLFILCLCTLPAKAPQTESAEANGGNLSATARKTHKKIAGESDLAAFVLAIVASAGITTVLVFVSANLLQSYGFGLFVGAPFGLGWIASVLYGIPKRRTLGECFSVAFASLALCGMGLIGFAFEGLICLIMALPIGGTLVLMGALVGYAMQSRPWTQASTPALLLGLCAVFPCLMAAESAFQEEPKLREVRTSVIVDASPEVVWNFVIAFPPLPEPTEAFFRSGVAYPIHAEIIGHGVGAVRHCVFSTGPFVEPITVWDAPNQLAFSVTSQPEPMKELSPYHIHPPHLDHFLVSKKGRFVLERLSDGRTRLEGTTWYTNKMWPEVYWGFLADKIIGAIHNRVLDHVKNLSETPKPIGNGSQTSFLRQSIREFRE